MPVRHEIDVDAGLVLVYLSGAVTSAEMLGYYPSLADDPAIRPGLQALVDCRRVTSVPPFGEMHIVANAQAQLPPGLRPTCAAVLVNKGWLYGIARQFGALVERVGIRVMPFLDEDEARRWLALGNELSLAGTPSVASDTGP